jgi:hypothetical protein
MSRGPGRIQQMIVELIESDSHGAWKVGQICEHLYPGVRVEKKHRVAVTRALRTMVLPSTWGVRMLPTEGSEYCLYDKCSAESTLRAVYLGWSKHAMMSFAVWQFKFPHHIKAAQEKVQDARRYRDASPVGKLDIGIADLNRRLRYAPMAGISGAALKPLNDELAELIEKKAELERAAI